MLHIVICNTRQHIALHYSSTTETLYNLVQYPKSSVTDRYPPPLRQRMDMFLVIMYQVYSNLTAVLCTGNITKTLFAHKEQSTTDFRSSQYSSSHILHFLFSRGRQALHILYSMLTYYNNIWYALYSSISGILWYYTCY